MWPPLTSSKTSLPWVLTLWRIQCAPKEYFCANVMDGWNGWMCCEKGRVKRDAFCLKEAGARWKRRVVALSGREVKSVVGRGYCCTRASAPLCRALLNTPAYRAAMKPWTASGRWRRLCLVVGAISRRQAGATIHISACMLEKASVAPVDRNAHRSKKELFDVWYRNLQLFATILKHCMPCRLSCLALKAVRLIRSTRRPSGFL